MMPWLNLDDAKGGRCPLELQKSKNGQKLENKSIKHCYMSIFTAIT